MARSCAGSGWQDHRGHEACCELAAQFVFQRTRRQHGSRTQHLSQLGRSLHKEHSTNGLQTWGRCPFERDPDKPMRASQPGRWQPRPHLPLFFTRCVYQPNLYQLDWPSLQDTRDPLRELGEWAIGAGLASLQDSSLDILCWVWRAAYAC